MVIFNKEMTFFEDFEAKIHVTEFELSHNPVYMEQQIRSPLVVVNWLQAVIANIVKLFEPIYILRFQCATKYLYVKSWEFQVNLLMVPCISMAHRFEASTKIGTKGNSYVGCLGHLAINYEPTIHILHTTHLLRIFSFSSIP